MVSPITISYLDDSNKARWDAFVESCPEATFFHRAGWKHVVEYCFGHHTYYLFAEREGTIQGILPMGHIKSLLFGNALISSPFCVYGGIAAVTQEARDALDTAASKLARDLTVDYLEMRNLRRCLQERPLKSLYVTFRKDLDPDPEKNLTAIPRKQRAIVRKGIKSGLTSVVDDDIDLFFNAYAQSVRNLGTPVLAKKFFRKLKDEFGDDCEVLVVELNRRVISAVMSFYFREEVLPYYGGGGAEARNLKSNDFMYWEVMRRAAENGVRVFDYGRSKEGTGSYRFKKHWGFNPQPLYYEFDLVNSKRLPDINPLNPKYAMFIALWKRLPVSVSKLVGPWVSRGLG